MSFSIDQFRLDGKVAIVTGAGGRGNSIGRAYALGLSRAGARVLTTMLAKRIGEIVDADAARGGAVHPACGNLQ